MSIYTGRYGDKRITDDKFLAVGISLGKPKFRVGYTISHQAYLLAPDRSMWGKTGDEFTKLYRAKLNNRRWDVLEVIGRLNDEAQSKGVDLLLLCFEDLTKGKTCHRTRLAKWYEEQTGEEMLELDYVGNEKQEPTMEERQLSFTDTLSTRG